MRDLASRVPADVRTNLAYAADVLERYGLWVAEALETLEQATIDCNWAATMRVASLDPAELAEPTDAEWSALEDVTGITRGWAVASKLARAVDAQNHV